MMPNVKNMNLPKNLVKKWIENKRRKDELRNKLNLKLFVQNAVLHQLQLQIEDIRSLQDLLDLVNQLMYARNVDISGSRENRRLRSRRLAINRDYEEKSRIIHIGICLVSLFLCFNIPLMV